LSDPTRRLLLDRLFDREGRNLQELQAEVPGMTRFGVMKHLRSLEAAGLVVSRKVGRERLHYLNPVPIQLIRDRWVSRYAQPRAMALSGLKAELEGDDSMAARPEQVYQVFIKARAEQVWDAITRPEFTEKYFYGARVETTGEAGTPIRYHSADGSGLWGDDVVMESDRPHRLVMGWRSLYDPEMAAEARSRVTWEIEEQPGGVCKLTVVHDQLQGAPKTAANVSGGWMFILSGLKTVLETGEPLRLGPPLRGNP
ncbi:MAG TPA: SRPBCC domain-containing protein, partial [Myxococcaceae bacterium]